MDRPCFGYVKVMPGGMPIDQQQIKIKRYAVGNGYTLREIISDDSQDGNSSLNYLETMLEMYPEADLIVVRVRYLSSSPIDFAAIFDHFPYGKATSRFISIDEGLDSASPQGILALKLLHAMHEYEAANNGIVQKATLTLRDVITPKPKNKRGRPKSAGRTAHNLRD